MEAFVRNAGKDEADRRDAGKLLAGWHREAVLDLPGAPLAFHPRAALWGALMAFRAASFICFRDVEEATIRQLLPDHSLPDDPAPEAHFSADLCLRHWPEMARMARARSEDDPLVKAMQRLAIQVPLSSLGMQIPVPGDHAVLRHPGLRQFFAERALERADHACLAVPEIATIVRSKLGAYSATLGRGLLSPTPLSES